MGRGEGEREGVKEGEGKEREERLSRAKRGRRGGGAGLYAINMYELVLGRKSAHKLPMTKPLSMEFNCSSCSALPWTIVVRATAQHANFLGIVSLCIGLLH